MFQDNLKEVLQVIRQEKKAEPVIIAVSKKQSREKIIEALESGHRHFGENQVKEAYEHWEDLKKKYPDVVLHLIGPLQSNKTKEAVALFDVIHTVDREKIAQSLSDEMKKQNKNIPCFIQVNTGNEEQKSGVAIDELQALYDFSKKAGLDIKGLMCIPPVDESATFHFALLKKNADSLGLKELSMGMSDDFEKALPHGTTHIRLGSKLFGNR